MIPLCKIKRNFAESQDKPDSYNVFSFSLSCQNISEYHTFFLVRILLIRVMKDFGQIDAEIRVFQSSLRMFVESQFFEV